MKVIVKNSSLVFQAVNRVTVDHPYSELTQGKKIYKNTEGSVTSTDYPDAQSDYNGSSWASAFFSVQEGDKVEITTSKYNGPSPGLLLYDSNNHLVTTYLNDGNYTEHGSVVVTIPSGVTHIGVNIYRLQGHDFWSLKIKTVG